MVNEYRLDGTIVTPSGAYDNLQQIRDAVRMGVEDQAALDEAERTVH